jgi:hypothetical protein
MLRVALGCGKDETDPTAVVSEPGAMEPKSTLHSQFQFDDDCVHVTWPSKTTPWPRRDM